MARRTSTSDGFTLIELLVVVTIIGVLASIAVPLLLRQRAAAWEATVRSDVRHAALAVESAADAGRYPDHLDVVGGTIVLAAGSEPIAAAALGMPSAHGTATVTARVSRGVVLAYASNDAGDRFCIAGAHERLSDAPVVVYDSAGGGLVTTGCGFDTDLGLPVGGQAPPTIVAGTFLRPGTHPFLYHPADAEGGFTTRGAGMDLLADHHDLGVGVFELSGAQASYAYSGGGWAVVVHGQIDAEQRFAGGYTVQLDRGYAGGEFVLREWRPDGEGVVRERAPVVRVPAGDFDWHAAHDVRVEVDGPRVRLLVNGAEVLSYDEMRHTEGAFGVRSWGGTNLSVDASRVVVGG